MTEQETIIRQLHVAATKRGKAFGDGGKAAAEFYKREMPDAETLLFMLAVASNNLLWHRERDDARAA